MKLLIVDNHTVHIQEIGSFLDCPFVVINMEELGSIDLDKFDGIILSGGSKYTLIEEPEKYIFELNLIKKFHKPILGICMGFEVLCYSYDENIEYLGFKELGAIKINVVKYDAIIRDMDIDFFAYECHRWKVSKLKNLTCLAESHEGIEIVKHSVLPHYGVQFHPEVLLKDGNNSDIIKNFQNIVKDFILVKNNY